MIRGLSRGQKGFTLIELLVVIAILGVIAAVVILNVGSLFGVGVVQAANTELHQVQTAVVAYIADNTFAANLTATIGPESNFPPGEPPTAGVHRYLLSPGMLQADYSVVNGAVVDAATVSGSRWGVTGTDIWFCSGMWQISPCS